MTNLNTAETGAGNETVTVTATVEGIEATCTGEFCFLVGGEEPSEATYEDDVIVTGYEDTGSFTQELDHARVVGHPRQPGPHHR